MNTATILSLFDAIQETTFEGISDEDREFCESEEKKYHKFNDYLEQLLTLPFPEHGKGVNDYNAFKRDTLFLAYNQNAAKFVENIVEYFRQTYKVLSLDDVSIFQSLLFSKNPSFDPFQNGRSGIYSQECCKSPTAQIVVNEIIRLLGGKSFQQKASCEMKATFRKGFNGKVLLKGATISLAEFLGYSYIWEDNRLEHHERTLPACYQCLWLFESGDSKIRESAFGLCPLINGNDRVVNVSTPYLLEGWSKVTSLKFYKNRRLDIRFSSNENAQAFFQEYCRI